MTRSLYILTLILFISSCKKEAIEESKTSMPYIVETPAGFPLMESPSDNRLTSSRVELGERLFFDTRLSRDNTVSCSSCHHPEKAFADGLIVSSGIDGQTGFRNSPSLANIGYNESFFADGGVPTLELQVMAPIHDEVEMDFLIADVADLLNQDNELRNLSFEAYDREIDPFVITRSIAAFERTLISGDAKYDRFLQNSEELSDLELEGLSIFEGEKGKCVSCHSGFNFTDNDFYNLGLYENYADEGRERITLNPLDNGKFKVPTLRNIDLTGPYMHDGSISSLEELIEFKVSGGLEHSNKSEKFVPLNLSQNEKNALIAFLKTLTDENFISKYEN